MMIKINLLPEESRKKKQERLKGVDLSRIDFGAISSLKLVFGVVGALMVLHIALVLISFYNSHLLRSLEAKYREASPKRNEAEFLKSRSRTIDRKISALDELMVRRLNWAKKLNDLGDSVTPGIWLSELSYAEKISGKSIPPEARDAPAKEAAGPGKKTAERQMERFLILSGYASSMGEEGTALVGRFIKSLKDNRQFYSDFSNIELGGIRRDRFDNQEVMSFRIVCLFKESAR